MAENICKICQKPFQGRPNKIYCTIQCRRQAEIAKRAEKCRLRVGAWPDQSERIKWDLPLLDNPDWPPFDVPGWEI